MSRFLFIHDFYRDGYHDMLAEVRILQDQGLWTKEKRVRASRYEMASYLQLKHHFPCMDVSYFAGRVAAIKSARTSHYPTRGKTIFILLGDARPAFCGSCGDPAIWKSPPDSSGLPVLFRCDRCKQERVRELTAYSTPDGWDWSEHEEDQLLPLPVGDKLLVSTRQGSFFFPVAFAIGSVFLEVALHLSLAFFLLELLLLVHFMTYHKEILQAFRKFLKSEW